MVNLQLKRIAFIEKLSAIAPPLVGVGKEYIDKQPTSVSAKIINKYMYYLYKWNPV